MANRVTLKMVSQQFQWYCENNGFPTPPAGQYPDNGQWYLSHSYGGWYHIARRSDEGTGESHPITNESYKLRELYNLLYFANQTHSYLKYAWDKALAG